MRVLVVFCHPLTESFQAGLHEVVVRELKAAGHEVDDCDLYAEGFTPVLSSAERANYYNVPSNREPVERYVQRILWAEALVFCFPTWNYNLPAMLKGFFDRLFLPGVSFEISPEGEIRTTLKHIRYVRAVVTYGSPRWAAFTMGDPPRKIMTRFLRLVIGAKVNIRYLAYYHVNKSTPETREKFKQRVAQLMHALPK